ncbi:Hypothetical protein A7982_08457 [Minicystis rosea]|nr:Hypothetical protein A7982_08457 [Minicystis rosea]
MTAHCVMKCDRGWPRPSPRGADGTIAAIFNGEQLWVRHAVSVVERPTEPRSRGEDARP